jgi:hypothetical protein
MITRSDTVIGNSAACANHARHFQDAENSGGNAVCLREDLYEDQHLAAAARFFQMLILNAWL